ncbi:hypothetical protein [Aliidongia dinghuensis]|uniref:hypothetical protein n=1 Tax=Aliidongia dinghuensis TaxID=1867774 RepID=UPI00166E8DBA|nr:hypothetical protein [Aliidongia dinghuensis]
MFEAGSFFFRTWSAADGVRRSAGYQRHDDARYARRATIRGEAAQDCEDEADFMNAIGHVVELRTSAWAESGLKRSGTRAAPSR